MTRGYMATVNYPVFGTAATAAPVTIDSNPGTSQRSGPAVSSFTYTGLTSTAAANCIVALVNVELRGSAVTSVVWDSAGANQAFTSLGISQEGAGSGVNHLEIWVLLAPASSGNKTVDIAWSGGTSQVMMACVSLAGVASTLATAFPAASRLSGTISSSSSPSFNITTATNHIALGLIANRGNNFSLPTGGTQIFLDNAGAGSNGAAQWGTGAATVAFGWTNDVSDFYGWAGCDASN